MKVPQKKNSKNSVDVGTASHAPIVCEEKPELLQQKVNELNVLNTQLASNLFLRTTTLRIERDQAVKKCEELQNEVTTLQSYVERYATVNETLLREGSSKRSVVEGKDRELAQKNDELNRTQALLAEASLRRLQLEQECHEMALEIKATTRENESLERKLADAERRISAASTKAPKTPAAPSPDPSLLSDLTIHKQKVILLTSNLKQACDALSVKDQQLAMAEASLKQQVSQRNLLILLCLMLITVEILSFAISADSLASLWFSVTSFSLPANPNTTSMASVAGDVANTVLGCTGALQCVSQ